MRVKVGDRILSYESLKKLCNNKKQKHFEVKILLAGGLMFSRKTVFPDMCVFSYIDESESEFKTEEQFKKYWSKYFGKGTIIFDGWC